MAEILQWHAGGSGSPTKTAARVADAIAARGDDGTWLSVVPRDQLLAAAEDIEKRPGARTLPLYGVPFGVKDSIDVEGVATTLSCPDYAYVASTTAPAVRRLLDAGALYVGKTNLDQFATGLNGTRTPYTVPRSVYGNEMISGGSSSGSALAVALGQVPFAVATDTAGSGRVPAALNGVVGFKPSRGLISTVGLVPACKSLDCISVMAGCVDDIDRVFEVMVARDDNDAWSRGRGPRCEGSDIRVGLPPVEELEFFGDDEMRRAHMAFREQLAGIATVVDHRSNPSWPPVPFSTRVRGWPNGWWNSATSSLPSPTRSIPSSGSSCAAEQKYTAVDAFAALQRLAELKAVAGRLWHDMDVLVVPTIGTTFTVDEVLARPIDCNTMLGHYTHFGNLLDLLGVAVPPGTTADGTAIERDAAWRGIGRRHRACACRADPRRTTRISAGRISNPSDIRGVTMSKSIEVPAEPAPFRSSRARPR